MTGVVGIFFGPIRQPNACDMYRIMQPLHYLHERWPDWKTLTIFRDDLHMLGVFQSDFWRRFVYAYDIYIFPRMYTLDQKEINLFQSLIDDLHAAGKTAVYEVDDDMTNEHRVVLPGADAVTCASMCDVITCTTPRLADLMTRKTGVKAYVLPNCFDPEVWYHPYTGQYVYQDKITLLLSGSKTHQEDWKVLENVLPRLMQNPDLHLLIMGYHPPYLQGLPHTSYLPGDNYDRYVQVIQTADIVLAPVNGDAFNNSKSGIKCIEGMAARRLLHGQNAGAACIASDHPIYQDVIQQGTTGMLVSHEPQAWYDGLTRLIEDSSLRHTIQCRSHVWVDHHHNIKKTVTQWKNVYSTVHKRRLKEAHHG